MIYSLLSYKRLGRVTEGNGNTGTVKDLPVFLFVCTVVFFLVL